MIRPETGSVNRFGKLNAMALVGLEVDDFDLLQAVFPFRQHRVVSKKIDCINFHQRTMRDKFFPVLL